MSRPLPTVSFDRPFRPSFWLRNRTACKTLAYAAGLSGVLGVLSYWLVYVDPTQVERRVAEWVEAALVEESFGVLASEERGPERPDRVTARGGRHSWSGGTQVRELRVLAAVEPRAEWIAGDVEIHGSATEDAGSRIGPRRLREVFG
ncbi:MAG: hypothetical protein AAF517_17235, partial [Planctomycetota bacterium]